MSDTYPGYLGTEEQLIKQKAEDLARAERLRIKPAALDPDPGALRVDKESGAFYWPEGHEQPPGSMDDLDVQAERQQAADRKRHDGGTWDHRPFRGGAGRCAPGVGSLPPPRMVKPSIVDGTTE